MHYFFKIFLKFIIHLQQAMQEQFKYQQEKVEDKEETSTKFTEAQKNGVDELTRALYGTRKFRTS